MWIVNLALRRPLTFIVLAIFSPDQRRSLHYKHAKGYFSEHRHPGRFGDF